MHSVLFLILAFFNAAALFLIAGAEFLAMILVIVYVGAVAVLFLFVVMMLDIDFAAAARGLPALRAGRRRRSAAILFLELVLVLGGWTFADQARRRCGSRPMPGGAVTNTRGARAASSTPTTSTCSRPPAWCCWWR